MTSDLDVRITDALCDAAAATTTSDDALDRIVRRAEIDPSGVGRRIALVGAATAVAAVGVAGIVILAPGRTQAPGSNDDTSVAETPTTVATAGTVPGPLVYDDATLLSILYVNFDAGQVQDQTRMFGDYPDEAAMAQCMHDAGYAYTAVPPHVETAATDPRYVMPPADFAAQYGFGFAAEALGLLPPAFTADPNTDLSLTPSEKEAYDTAQSGCVAEQTAQGTIVVLDQAWVAAHDYAWEQFQSIVDTDDRVVAALATWHNCMSAAGFDYDDPAAIATAFQDRLDDYGPSDFPVDPGAPEYAEISQIMAEEIATASANATCVEPYTATLRGVILDHFDEYKSVFGAALAAGVQTDAAG